MSGKTVNTSFKTRDWITTIVGALILGFSVGALLFPPIALQNRFSSLVSPSLFYPLTLLVKGILIIIGFWLWYQIRNKAYLNKIFWIITILALICEFIIALSFV